MGFSERTDGSNRLNRLTQLLHRLQKENCPVLDLTESNPTRCQFQYPPEIFSALNDTKNLVYEPSPKGMFEAREVVAGYYAEKGSSVNPEHIFLTASTSEAYAFLFRLLLNPGEHLLVPRPSYPLFEYLALLNDVTVGYYPLIYDKKWEVDTNTLKQSVTSRTRALVLVHPNNPTGSFVKRSEKEFLVRCAKKNNLSLICDEVFLDYAYEKDPTRVVTFSECGEVLTFTLSGISKILGLPQMKLSWMVVNGPKKLCEQAVERLEVIADTYLSVNAPSQQALKAWFSFRSILQGQIQKRVLANRKALQEWCATSDCELLHAEGGWYAILKLPNAKTEEEWALEFLEKEHILVHPGYFFDFDEGTHIVMSLLVPSDRFKEGIKRLLSSVQECNS